MATREIFGFSLSALALIAGIALPAPASAACLGVEAYAHRGHPSKPENSAASVALGRSDGFDGPEFDIAALADGSFALTHDLFPGRAVKGAPRKFVRDIAPPDWRKATLAGRKGERTAEPAALLDQALPLAAKALSSGGKALVEIKAATCEQARSVAGYLQWGLPPGSLMLYSLKPEIARCAAEGLPEGSRAKVGLAFAPDPATLEAESPRGASLAALAASKAGLGAGKVYAAAAGGSAFGPGSLRSAAEISKNPIALVDAETIRRDPSILEEAKRRGVFLVAYGRLGGERMALALLEAKKAAGSLPQGAVLDEIPSEAFCPALAAGARR